MEDVPMETLIPPARAATRVTHRTPGGLTRRSVLRRAAGLAGAALVTPAATVLVAPTHRASAAAASAGQLSTFENDEAGFNTKTFFYDTGEAVIAFDTQFTPEFAEQAIAYLRTQTANPLAYAVITHPNPDKFNGLTAFQEAGARVVASRATVEAMPVIFRGKCR
jgi:glyoxylase-like metal-dependent hydrolase (beta-lactamase superfamily II)